MLALLLGLVLPLQAPAGLVTALDQNYSVVVPAGKHKLDVFAPARGKNLPVLLYVHGGSLQEGDRKDYRWLGRELALQRYVVVIPSYRLYPSVTVSGAVMDVGRALAWTVRHAGHYGGSPRRIVLIGHSAGGYLTAILPFDARYLQAAGVAVGSIRGVFELSADYSNRDPDPGESHADVAVDHRIYGESAEQRDANSVYRYLHRTLPFEATCESIDPGTQCIDRDHFVALLRGYGSPVLTFTEPHATHDDLVKRIALPGDPLNRELQRFVRMVTR